MDSPSSRCSRDASPTAITNVRTTMYSCVRGERCDCGQGPTRIAFVCRVGVPRLPPTNVRHGAHLGWLRLVVHAYEGKLWPTSKTDGKGGPRLAGADGPLRQGGRWRARYFDPEARKAPAPSPASPTPSSSWLGRRATRAWVATSTRRPDGSPSPSTRRCGRPRRYTGEPLKLWPRAGRMWLRRWVKGAPASANCHFGRARGRPFVPCRGRALR